jgi:hypothetical protein
VLRYRLQTRWTLRARLAFWLGLAGEVLAIGLVARWFAWIWLLPLTLPLAQLYLDNECRRSRRWVDGLLEALAAERGLKPVPAQGSATRDQSQPKQ